MANKERYTVAQVIEALRKTRGMKGPAATLLKCHRDTVDAYSKRHPTVAAVIAEERESMTDTAELSLARAITKGEAWAVCFYLKTQGKDRGYVETHKLELAVEREMESMLGALEDSLEPNEFRKVAAALASVG